MKISHKITKLSEGKKDFITECIFVLAKLDFRKEFLIWFKDKKLDLNSDNGIERE